ncbi:MAG: sulfotransferase [Bacteroidetes bacterium]|nr:sulfotransferase [Bacteroidota bacterium]
MRRTNFTFPVSTLAGSTVGNLIQLLRRYKAERKYYFKASLSILVAAVFSPFNWIEKFIWNRRIENFQMKAPPLFIIGFNRSGTTLLQNLLCQDPKAGYTTTLHTVFPHCVLSQKWWMSPLINLLVPDKRPFDNVSMDMNFPQEEEFAMTNLQPFSVYNFFVFPAEFDRFVDGDYFTGSLPAKDLARWKYDYRRLVVKSLLNTRGVRYISKNPQNIPRVDILRELYPGAGFIFIYRDPYVVVESFYHFILAIFTGIQLQTVPAGFSRKNVARFYSIAMKHYLGMRSNPGSPFIYEVKMEDFVTDPIAGLNHIYTELGLGGYAESVPLFKAYLSENSHSPRNQAYDIHEDTIRFVNQYASEIVLQFGYPLREEPRR